MKGTDYSFYYKKESEITATKQDETYLRIATEIARLSKDEQTHVGCVIIDKDRKVVSMGYNGCPSNFGTWRNQTDAIVPHSREEKQIYLRQTFPKLGITETAYQFNKYPFMIHSEQNAILTCSDRSRLNGATLYCTHYPCSVCALLIAQSGIKHIKVIDNRHGTFNETIVPTLYVYENMNITLTVFEK